MRCTFTFGFFCLWLPLQTKIGCKNSPARQDWQAQPLAYPILSSPRSTAKRTTVTCAHRLPSSSQVCAVPAMAESAWAHAWSERSEPSASRAEPQCGSQYHHQFQQRQGLSLPIRMQQWLHPPWSSSRLGVTPQTPGPCPKSPANRVPSKHLRLPGKTAVVVNLQLLHRYPCMWNKRPEEPRPPWSWPRNTTQGRPWVSLAVHFGPLWRSARNSLRHGLFWLYCRWSRDGAGPLHCLHGSEIPCWQAASQKQYEAMSDLLSKKSALICVAWVAVCCSEVRDLKVRVLNRLSMSQREPGHVPS